MEWLHYFILSEYSLIISIIGAVLGILVSIAGMALKREPAIKAGIGMLILFIVFCVGIMAYKYKYMPLDTVGISSSQTTLPDNQGISQPVETPSGSQSTPQPAATPSGSQSTPQPAATPSGSQSTPQPAATPSGSQSTPRPNTESSSTPTPAPTATPDPGNMLNVEPITASFYGAAAIIPSDYSVPDIEIITIPGNMYTEKQSDDYAFIPEINGTYRFEFSGVPSATYLDLRVLNSGEELLNSAINLDNEDGVTATLNAQNNYIIRVSQHKNLGSYTLNIGSQKPVIDISQLTEVNDSIQYTDQENNYLFSAQRDGLYNFEFSDVPDGTDLALYVYNSGWELIKSAIRLDNGDGLPVSLVAGNNYYIQVRQDRSIGTYKLNVGQKKEIIDVSPYTAVSDIIQYTNQENDYLFTAQKDGLHRFEFSDVPDGTDLSLYIYNSGWELVQSAINFDNSDGLSVSLTAGTSYYIRVKQYEGTGNYVLNIGQKKEIVNVSNYTDIADSVQYTHQENDYSFDVSSDGTYRLAFSDVPDGTDLSMYVYNSGQELINSSINLDSGDGMSVSLTAGKTYYIRVKQYKGYGTYRLHIQRQENN